MLWLIERACVKKLDKGQGGDKRSGLGVKSIYPCIRDHIFDFPSLNYRLYKEENHGPTLLYYKP